MMNAFLNQVSGYFASYWGMIIVAVAFAIYALFQRKQAVQIILSLMLRVEKEAEALALATGDAKFAFVVEKGYQILPRAVRMFITYGMFEEFAKRLYVSAKEYLLRLNNPDENQKPFPEELQERKETDPG